MPFLLTPAASAFSFRIASVAWLSVHGVGETVSLDHQIPVDLIIQRIREARRRVVVVGVVRSLFTHLLILVLHNFTARVSD
jgi:hypothetical protein